MKSHIAAGIIGLFYFIAFAHSEEIKGKDEVMIELQKLNCFKRASVVHKGNRFLVFTGGQGSGKRIHRAFIYEEVKEGLILKHSIVDDPRVAIYGLYPEIEENEIRLILSGRNGDEVLTTLNLEEMEGGGGQLRYALRAPLRDTPQRQRKNKKLNVSMGIIDKTQYEFNCSNCKITEQIRILDNGSERSGS